MQSLILLLLLNSLLLAHSNPTTLFLNDQINFNFTNDTQPTSQNYQISMPSSSDADVALITVITEAKSFLSILIDFGASGDKIYPTNE